MLNSSAIMLVNIFWSEFNNETGWYEPEYSPSFHSLLSNVNLASFQLLHTCLVLRNQIITSNAVFVQGIKKFQKCLKAFYNTKWFSQRKNSILTLCLIPLFLIVSSIFVYELTLQLHNRENRSILVSILLGNVWFKTKQYPFSYL